jgi:hypothetical protein
MEFGQLHSKESLSVEHVKTALKGMLLPEFIHKRGHLKILVVGPWHPADLWTGSSESSIWSVLFESHRDTLFSDAGEAKLKRGSIERRLAPLHPAELLARALGNGLVTLFSDASGFYYTLVWRERHLRFSLMLEQCTTAAYKQRTVRCDGVQVVVETDPKEFPEQDRVGVLLEGWNRWLGERIPVEEERIFVPEALSGLGEDQPWHTLIEDGAWL